MGRGKRLEAERKKKAKVRKFIKEVWCRSSYGSREQLLSSEIIGKVAHTPHSCSKICCSNPRKWRRGKEKLTIQERRQLAA